MTYAYKILDAETLHLEDYQIDPYITTDLINHKIIEVENAIFFTNYAGDSFIRMIEDDLETKYFHWGDIDTFDITEDGES